MDPLTSPPAGVPPVASIPWWRRWRTILVGAFALLALVDGAAKLADVAADYWRAEAETLTSQAETAQALASATELYVGRYVGITQTVSRVIFTPSLGDGVRHQLLVGIRQANPEVEVAALVGPDGVVVDADPPAVIGVDVSGHYLIGRIGAGASSWLSDLLVGPIVQAPGFGIAAAGRAPDGTLRGVVAVRLLAVSLARELAIRLSGDAHALVIDRTGRVIVHGLRPDLDWSRRDFSRVPLVADALAGRAVATGRFTSPLSDVRMLGAVVTVPGLDWVVGVVQPVETALAAARQALRVALLETAAVLGLGVGLALFLSGLLSRPVAALAAGVGAVSRGELGHRIATRWRSEFGWLARSFNAMAARLEAARRQEQALKDQLTAANERLQANAVRLEGSLAALEEARQHAALLAQASKTLAASLDHETTLASVARLLVPDLADWCVINLVEADRSVRAVAAAHTDPARERLLGELQRYPLEPDGPHPIATVLRTGRAVLVAEVTEDWLAAVTSAPEHLRILRDAGFTSYMGVPLVARGRTLGAISFVAADSGRRYGPDDLALAAELAGRAAIAVDNARLYQQAQEAIRVRDEFLARASHELRTPLTVVKGHLSLLARRVPSSEGIAARLIAIGLQHVERMVRLIADLLDASRLAAGRLELAPEPLDLRRIAAEASAQVAPLAQEKGVMLVEAVPAGLALVGDRLRLEQVVVNLLTNAIRHTPAGGAVRVEGVAIGAAVQMRVCDTGAGIPPEHLERIFEPFYQVASATGRRKAAGQGTGLGLSIVRRLVELHGGSVRAESEGQGRGSTFTVTLPRLQPGSRAA